MIWTVLFITGLVLFLIGVPTMIYWRGWHNGYSRAWQDVADATREAEKENHNWQRK